MSGAHFLDASHVQLAIAVMFILALCYGLASDVSELRIPNSVSIILVGLFFLNRWLFPASGSLMSHAIVAGAAFLVAFALFAAGLMGGGDVKLIGAVMLWAGPANGPGFLILMAFIGGASAACLLILQRLARSWPGALRFVPSRQMKAWVRLGIFPYGIAICVAALVLTPSFFGVAR